MSFCSSHTNKNVFLRSAAGGKITVKQKISGVLVFKVANFRKNMFIYISIIPSSFLVMESFVMLISESSKFSNHIFLVK